MYESDKTRWKISRVIFVLLAVLIIGFIGYLVFGNKSDTNPNPYVKNEKNNESNSQPITVENPKTVVNLGQAASSGDFEITVSGIKCGDKTIGTNEYAHSDASGEYCRLKMSVKNNGDKSQSFPADKIKLFDSKEEEYSFDSTATLYTQSDLNAQVWYENIDAGSTQEGEIAFDKNIGSNPVKVQIFNGTDSTPIEIVLN